ncbi:MAG: DUF4932 domain-containing protein [candidate division Zixibacteria bacterium]|nr:DUF4932 domain-containing protein [candidate division Zixibacteria bacterium]
MAMITMSKRVKVQIEANPVLFTAGSLLNAVGYNSDSSWQYTPIRAAVRLALANTAQRWQSQLDKDGILGTFLKGNGAVLMDIVPLIGGIPNFEPLLESHQYSTCWQSESKKVVNNVARWLRCFYREERITHLWNKAELEYKQQIKLIEQQANDLACLAEEIGGLNNDYLKIVVWPNPVDAIGRGYSLSCTDCTWLFVGHLTSPFQAKRLLVHELLHRWVDPIAEREALLYDLDPMPKVSARYRMVAEGYPDLAIWMAELVVRSLTAWYLPDPQLAVGDGLKRWIEQEESYGFIGLGSVYSYLESKTSFSPDVIDESVAILIRNIGISR